MNLSNWQKCAARETRGDMVHNILRDWEHDRKELVECARRLEIFAWAYRFHPKRNPEDKLDEVLAIFERLK